MARSEAATRQSPNELGPVEVVGLAPDEVHVWCAFLDQPALIVRYLTRSLSPDERARAEGFAFDRDRRRFVVARGALRAILGRYLDVEPVRLGFTYDARGKPALAPPWGGETLRFNVAHSHELALYALTRERAVGIDVEYLRPVADLDDLAGRCFAPGENAVLRRLPAHQREEAFFACWTRKEAYVKAIGEGLTRPLDAFEVSLAPGEPARLLCVRDEPGEASRWSLHDLRPAPGYVGALAIEGRGVRVRRRRWP